MRCARDLDGHIVCSACCCEWQLEQCLALDEAQKQQLEKATQQRQERAEGLAKNMNSIVAHGAQLLGTAAGGAVAAAAGGSIALGAGLAKGVVAGASAVWPRSASRQPLPSQEEVAEKNHEDQHEEQ